MQAKPFPAVTALPARSGFTELIKWEQKKGVVGGEGGGRGWGRGREGTLLTLFMSGPQNEYLPEEASCDSLQLPDSRVDSAECGAGRARGEHRINNQDLQRNFGEMPWCGQTTVLLLLLLLKMCVVVHCATALCAVVPWLHVQSNSVAELMLQPVQTRCGGCC